MMGTYILYYLAAINVITFVVYGIDKLKAKKEKWRIPEATLLLLAIVGGSIGASGMRHFPFLAFSLSMPYTMKAMTLIAAK